MWAATPTLTHLVSSSWGPLVARPQKEQRLPTRFARVSRTSRENSSRAMAGSLPPRDPGDSAHAGDPGEWARSLDYASWRAGRPLAFGWWRSLAWKGVVMSIWTRKVWIVLILAA